MWRGRGFRFQQGREEQRGSGQVVIGSGLEAAPDERQVVGVAEDDLPGVKVVAAVQPQPAMLRQGTARQVVCSVSEFLRETP